MGRCDSVAAPDVGLAEQDLDDRGRGAERLHGRTALKCGGDGARVKLVAALNRACFDVGMPQRMPRISRAPSAVETITGAR